MKILRVLLVNIIFVLCGITAPIYAIETQPTALEKQKGETVIFINDKSEVLRQNINSGEEMLEPSHTDKEGFEFIGWQSEETGEYWDFSKPVTKDLTLVARYSKVSSASKENLVNTKTAKTTTIANKKKDLKTESRNVWYLLIGGFITGIFCVILIYRKRGRESEN